MSTRIIRELVDDLDGAAAAETLSFAVNHIEYEIDLSDEHLKTFHEFMQPFIQQGRRQVTGPRARRPAGSTAAPVTAPAPRAESYTRLSKEQNKALRDWAAKNGYDIPPRGRIPKHIIAAFETAHAR